MPLTDTKLRSLKTTGKPYKAADEHGLYAHVAPSGTISFRYDYRVNGRRETLTMGRYPATTLAQARVDHARARSMVAQGESPAKRKSVEKVERNKAQTFTEWAAQWGAEHPVSARTEQGRTLALRVPLAQFGTRKLADIGPRDVLAALDTLKDRGASSVARRARIAVKQVFDYAIARQEAATNPAAAIKAALYGKDEARQRALSPGELRTLLRAIEHDGANPITKAAMRLLLLTGGRKQEILRARWPEFDLDAAEWRIPAERMKMRRPHTVYLSRQAVRLLRDMQKVSGCEHVFRISLELKPIGIQTLNSALLRIEKTATLDHFTVHDLRRTMSTLLHEQGFNPDVIETALGHSLTGVRAVYNRAKYEEERRKMMQAWADYLDALAAENVIPLEQRRA